MNPRDEIESILVLYWALAAAGRKSWDQIRCDLVDLYTEALADRLPRDLILTIEAAYWMATGRSALQYIEQMIEAYPDLEEVAA